MVKILTLTEIFQSISDTSRWMFPTRSRLWSGLAALLLQILAKQYSNLFTTNVTKNAKMPLYYWTYCRKTGRVRRGGQWWGGVGFVQNGSTSGIPSESTVSGKTTI